LSALLYGRHGQVRTILTDPIRFFLVVTCHLYHLALITYVHICNKRH
jgi:hypothetical protein